MRRGLGFLCLCLCLVPPAFAQLSTSTMMGRVTDSSGAVIPGVSVAVVNTATNFKYSAETNAEGMFRVLSLLPGNYKVTFEAGGFKRLVRDTDIRTGETLPINATLEVGAVTESIEVSGRQQLLETETSSTGSVVEGQMIYDMPIYQRWTASTFQMVPGMQQQGGAWGGSLGSYHVAGQRSSAIGFFEDGVMAQDQLDGTNQLNPILNTIEEVKVLSTALPAEYGHSAGGVITTVKKSGTNEFHGIASMFGRGRRMMHRRFADKCMTSQQDLAQGCREQGAIFFQPDINLSGPVYIPKLYDGRNKTFFFVGWQRLIEKKALQGETTVPTADMKNGIFTLGGRGQQIYDPFSTTLANGAWSRQPLAGNTVPQSMIDPISRKIIQINPWKAENQPGNFSTTGPLSNLLYDQRSNVFFDDWSYRFDHQFNQSVKLYASYSSNDRRDLPRPTRVVMPEFDAENGAWVPSRRDNLSVGNTWVFGPTIVNDARFGYFRYRTERIAAGSGDDLAKQLGIPNVGSELLPGLGNQYGVGGMAGPNVNLGETFSFRDDLAVARGSHAFKMGYELLKFRLNSTQQNRPSGDFSFSSMAAGLQANGAAAPNTGIDFAAFLMGAVRQATFDSQLARWEPRSSIHSFYFQDDWKARPNLTFNLGVRYSNESPFHTVSGRQTNWSPTAIDDITGKKGAFIHPSGNLYARDSNNFQPRIGAAWNFRHKWVFRGGFAVNTVDIKYPSSREHLEEYVAQANLERAAGDPRVLFRLKDGPPAFKYATRSDGTSPYLGTNFSGRGAAWVDGNLRNPYVLNWNGSLQYELNTRALIELSYQGSSGNGLIENWLYNVFPVTFGANDPALRDAAFARTQDYLPFSNFGNVRLRSNAGHSSYHAGTIKLERRLSGGVTFMTFYTWSKSLNSQDGDNSGSGVDPVSNRALERARASWDRTHRFNFTGTWELPFGKGRKRMNSNRALDLVFGGWEISGIETLESGNPLNFGFSNSPNNYFPTSIADRRPDLVGKPAVLDNWRNFGGGRFSTATINPVLGSLGDFAYPAAFRVGTAGRNIIDGLPLVWTTVSAQKNFRITERLKAQLRWDMNNPFKTFNFNAPNTTVDTRNPQNFGKTTSDLTTASWGGQPLMNLTLAIMW
ncbi:MAG: TonB-dependent receptor [Bryobacterales bacterium]|nr:TonB-dependent receptor [Bryobacterales bacterium]